jgi:uncharacterized protein YjbJ (UPF0337 family)
MNWREVQGHWEQFKTVLRAYWPELTDGDLNRVDGSRERLAELLREYYCCEADEAERRIAEFEKDVRYPGAVK